MLGICSLPRTADQLKTSPNYPFTTNSMRFTAIAEYLLTRAKYRGARSASSRRQPASATSTRNMPSEKLSARVRSATALPHTTGHASNGLSSTGARWSALTIMFSNPAEARFKTGLQGLNAMRTKTIVASEATAFYEDTKLDTKPPQQQPSRASWPVCADATPSTNFPGNAPRRTNTEHHPRHQRGCSRKSVPRPPQYRAAQ
jgi:hypothetical protein